MAMPQSSLSEFTSVELQPVPVPSIPTPQPRLPRYRPPEISNAAIAARYGALSVNLTDLILLDTESRQTSDKEWQITEIAALRPEASGAFTVLAYRQYQTAHAENYTWTEAEVRFWRGLLSGQVLVGHNISADFEQLQAAFQEFGQELNHVGLLDTLELAQIAFPLIYNPERGTLDHKLHFLAGEFNLDKEDSLTELGRPHQAGYDAALCWRLAQKALAQLRTWPKARLEAVLQLLAPSTYLQRFLIDQLWEGHIQTRRVPLINLLGPLPTPPGQRSASPPIAETASHLLGETGPFKQKKVRGFEPRPIQVELAQTITDCLENGGILMAEAGTGTGKSLAALVPALIQARVQVDKPVVISTFTHLLQHQLTSKDLPAMVEALEKPVRVVVLKGKGNYLDLEAFDAQRTAHLRELSQNAALYESHSTGLFLAYLLSWLCAGLDQERQHLGDGTYTFFADLENVSGWWRQAYGSQFLTLLHSLQQEPALLEEGLSEHGLPHFFARAIQFAKQAELVVVNHSLWLSSKPVQELSSRVIFDEAHHLEEAATDAQTKIFSTDGCRAWVRLAKGLSAAIGAVADEKKLAIELFSAAEALNRVLPDFAVLFRRCLDHLAPPELIEHAEERDLADDRPYARRVWLSRPGVEIAGQAHQAGVWLDEQAGATLAEKLDYLYGKLAWVITLDDLEQRPDLKRLAKSLIEQISEGLGLLRAVQSAKFEESPDLCWWLEEDDRDVGQETNAVQYFTLKHAPIRVASFLRQTLATPDRASILISATLSLRGGETVGPAAIDQPEAAGFQFLSERLGLTNPHQVKVWSRPSPFNYQRQLRVLLRQTLRSPSDPDEGKYLHELHAELLNLIRNAPTRGLVLFTSRRHLLALHDAIQEAQHQTELHLAPPVRLLPQYPGESATSLVQKYRELIDQDKQTLLLGTGSFWEGVDLSGSYGLQSLVVVRLPFPAAGDPLVQARCQEVELRCQGEYGGAYRHYLLPLTLLKWRQGVGRLIRDHQSRGVVICLDRRVATSDYAHNFWQALPAGSEGGPELLPCYTPAEMVHHLAVFWRKNRAEYLEIAEQPWQPQSGPIPTLNSITPIDQQEGVMIKAARHLVGDSFQRNEAQIRAMIAFYQGQDVLLTMPTGGGKSLCYQVPALIAHEGLTVVFSPLRALIENQISELGNCGVPIPDRAGYLLGRDAQDHKLRARVRQLAEDGQLRLLYLTPEMAGLDFTLFARLGVRRIVLDEAHCMLTWGETFRPDYLRLAQRIRDWRKQVGQDIALMACSATLTLAQQKILQEYLGLKEPVIIPGTVDRPNLYWGVDVMPKRWGYRDRRLQEILARLPHYAQAIVYTTYTRTCEQIAEGLCRHGFRAAAYHGRMDNIKRQEIRRRFENGPEDLQTIVATKAFGMGINNRQVALVVHYNHPESLTEYYQQAGRAGRDRSWQALALTLYSHNDVRQHEFLQNRSRLEKTTLENILVRVSPAGQFVPEKELLTVIGGEPVQASRILRQALELLARTGVIGFYEIVAAATLALSWGCPVEPPDHLSQTQVQLLAAWLRELKTRHEYFYQAPRDVSLDSCQAAEALLGLGAEANWWRVVDTQRYIWLQRGPNFGAELSTILAEEAERSRSELQAMINFLEDDTTCRRPRLVQAFNSAEIPGQVMPCCDVCQVGHGLGHPWLTTGPQPRFSGQLWPVEAEIFAYLEQNREANLDKLLPRIQGSPLASEERLKAYLTGLQRLNLTVKIENSWQLTDLGHERLEQRRFPTWNEVVKSGIG